MIQILVLFMLFCLPAQATGPDPVARFEHLSIEHGLSQSSVYSILQDRKGFMWFATADGLNRYDGYGFKVFRHHPKDPGSLSSSFIRTLFEDANGILWIGTQGGGLNRFDRQTERFVHYRHEPENSRSLSHNDIRAIYEDRDGVLWVGTNGGGLNRFDRQTQTFVRWQHDVANNSLSDDRVRSILQDSKGLLWVGTDGGGLNRFDPVSQHFTHFKHQPNDAHSLSNDRISMVYEDKKGVIWIATDGGGLNRFDDKTQGFQHFVYDVTNPDSLGHNRIRSIFEDHQGRLWLGTIGSGLNRFDGLYGGDQRFVRFNHHVSDPNGLNDHTIWSINEDANGVLWVGTQSGGVNRYDSRSALFGHVRQQPSVSGGLDHSSTRSFLITHRGQQADKGTLWVGTDGGLNHYHRQTRRFTHFIHDSSDANSLSEGSVTALFEDHQGTVWVGTIGGGLNKFDPATGHFKHFAHNRNDPHSLSSDHVLPVYGRANDTSGTLWVGTFDGGLNKFNPQTEQFTHFRHQPNNPGSLSHDTVWSVRVDNTGTLWVGTLNGLDRYDAQTGQFKHFKHQLTNPRSLSHNSVKTIYQDSKGTLWLGTGGGGLNKFDAITEQFHHYREKDGLANDYVYGIVEDDSAHLWLSTNNGLSRFDPVSETFSNFDVNDGLQSNEFNTGAYLKGVDGELFFGGIKGFNHFLPENIGNDQQVPQVVLTQFLLFNQPVAVKPNTGDVVDRVNRANRQIFTLPKAIDELTQLTLSYQQDLMSFEFAALHFVSPMHNRYAYRLKGWDKEWMFTDAKNRRATYTNIPPGHYTLQVKASNKNGYWNEQGKSLDITILPPLWRTWWAYTLYVLLLWGLIMLALFILNERRKGLGERALNLQLKQVDKLKDAFLANTSHELRTPLNGIIGLTESLMDGVAGPVPPKVKHQLAMVVSSGKRLSNLVNDILDSAKLENHNLTLHCQPVNLRQMVELVLTLSQHLTADKALVLVNDVPDDLPGVQADEARLQQVLYNLVGNGIKFTEQGQVSVSAIQQGGWLKISVSDSGIGIKADQFGTIFKSFEQVQGDEARRYGGTGLGLAVSRQLVQLHGGQLEVASQIGEGSTFSFTLPVSDVQPVVDGHTSQALARLQSLKVEQRNINNEANSNEAYIALSAAEHKPLFEPLPEHLSDGSRFRLLLVDDEPVNRLVLRNYLSAQNYQLTEAAGGKEALEIIREQGPFDLVLLDIMMPEVSGFDVCQTIRQTIPANELPVIFLTAKNQQADVLQSFAVGANDYLTKPVLKYELLARVDTHLKLLDSHRHLERKVTERTEELVTAQQQLVLSEKMASLGTLTAGVAHEINNPTNFVHVSAQNLEVDLASCQQFIFDLADEADEEILASFRKRFQPLHDHLSMIKNGTERIKATVQDLRAFSQTHGGEQKTVKITELLQSTVNLVQTKYFEVAEFVIDFDANPDLLCYPAQLNQVFMNLIVNACDAIREKQQQDSTMRGQVSIGCCLVDDAQRPLEISVRDNGNGMSEQTKQKLFEPFYTTKGVGEGTGLGLSISYGIVQQHEGELAVESQLTVGTVFILRLPLPVADQQEAMSLMPQPLG